MNVPPPRTWGEGTLADRPDVNTVPLGWWYHVVDKAADVDEWYMAATFDSSSGRAFWLVRHADFERMVSSVLLHGDLTLRRNRHTAEVVAIVMRDGKVMARQRGESAAEAVQKALESINDAADRKRLPTVPT